MKTEHEIRAELDHVREQYHHATDENLVRYACMIAALLWVLDETPDDDELRVGLEWLQEEGIVELGQPDPSFSEHEYVAVPSQEMPGIWNEERVGLPTQPHVGAICEDPACSHFAVRHNEKGCSFGPPDGEPCPCRGMLWQGIHWPRPWLPAPAGIARPG